MRSSLSLSTSAALFLATVLLGATIRGGKGFSTTTIMSTSKPTNIAFGLNVAFHVKPERRDEFLEVFSNHVTKSLLEEPNSIQFQLGQDMEDPNVFFLHEQFKDISDHRGKHSNSEHYQGVVAFMETSPLVGQVVDEFNLCHPGPNEKVGNRECVCLNVELNIKPEVREEFLRVIRNNKEGSDAEPGCLQYSWGENIETPNKFHFHEQYIGEEGVAAHSAAPHFKLWEEFAGKDPFTKPPVVQKFKALVIATI